MAENASVFQGVQLGKETTPGTAVAATKKLTAMSFDPSPAVEISTFKPSGSKYNTLTAQIYEQVDFDVAGQPTYTEIIYALSSLITLPTPTTPGGGTLSRRWTFESAQAGPDAPATYTAEVGSTERGHRFTNAIISELSFGFSKTGEPEMSGSGFGRALEDPFTLTTAGLSTIALIPVLPTQVNVYSEATGAATATPSNRLTRDFEWTWSLGGRYSPVRVLNAANSSFETHVEAEPDLTMGLTTSVDTQGMGFLADLRAGTPRFIAMHAQTTSFIETTIPYDFWVDTCGAVNDTDGFDDTDGSRTVSWSFAGLYNGTWGKAFSIRATNTLTAL
jgi:hypothetical protein